MGRPKLGHTYVKLGVPTELIRRVEQIIDMREARTLTRPQAAAVYREALGLGLRQMLQAEAALGPGAPLPPAPAPPPSAVDSRQLDIERDAPRSQTPAPAEPAVAVEPAPAPKAKSAAKPKRSRKPKAEPIDVLEFFGDAPAAEAPAEKAPDVDHRGPDRFGPDDVGGWVRIGDDGHRWARHRIIRIGGNGLADFACGKDGDLRELVRVGETGRVCKRCAAAPGAREDARPAR